MLWVTPLSITLQERICLQRSTYLQTAFVCHSQISEKYGLPTERIAKVYKKSKKGWARERDCSFIRPYFLHVKLNFCFFFVSGSWWTWTTTSSSITPTKTPSSSTSRATQTPTRSRWRRSDGPPAEPKARRSRRKKRRCDCRSAEIYEAAIDWLISWLTVLGDSPLVGVVAPRSTSSTHPIPRWHCYTMKQVVFPVPDEDTNGKRTL